MGLSGSSITKIFTKHNKLECDGYHYLSEMYNSTLLKQANVHNNHELCNKNMGLLQFASNRAKNGSISTCSRKSSITGMVVSQNEQTEISLFGQV